LTLKKKVILKNKMCIECYNNNESNLAHFKQRILNEIEESNEEREDVCNDYNILKPYKRYYDACGWEDTHVVMCLNPSEFTRIPEDEEEFMSMYANIKRLRNKTLQNQRFIRYIYNFNIEKAEENHKKLTECETTDMEEILELTLQDKNVEIVAQTSSGEQREQYKGQRGYLEFCNGVKKNYEARVIRLKQCESAKRWSIERVNHTWLNQHSSQCNKIETYRT